MILKHLYQPTWFNLIVAHVVTPFIPMAFPVRVVVTAAMAAKYNWLKVSFVANTASTLSLTAQYFLFQLFGSRNWSDDLGKYPIIDALVQGIEAHMFVALIVLNIIPIPETLLALVASMKQYPIILFALAMFIGRLTHTVPMALGGLGFKWFWQQINRKSP